MIENLEMYIRAQGSDEEDLGTRAKFILEEADGIEMTQSQEMLF